MMIAVFNNLPELILGLTWTIAVFSIGKRYGRWRATR